MRVEGFLPNGGAVFESPSCRSTTRRWAGARTSSACPAGTHTRNHLPLLGLRRVLRHRLRHSRAPSWWRPPATTETGGPFWPAAFPWTVSVGAPDPDGAKGAVYSNFGSWVDLYAAGMDLVNAFPPGTYTCKEPPNVGQVRQFDGLASWSGTSFATPTVAGHHRTDARTGESARAAADALLAIGSDARSAGVGSVLSPGPQNLPN